MRKDRAIDAIVSYITAGDEKGALRFYVENRVSFGTYQEAVRRARAWLRHFEARK